MRQSHPVANRHASVAEPALFAKDYGSDNDEAQNDCQGCNAVAPSHGRPSSSAPISALTLDEPKALKVPTKIRPESALSGNLHDGLAI